MFVTKFVFFHIASTLILEQVASVTEPPKIEDNEVLKVETAIRDTINKLFSILNSNNTKELTYLRHYSTIHDYFLTLKLQDYHILYDIAQLTRVDYENVDNATLNFITVLNKVLSQESSEERPYSIRRRIEHFDNEVLTFVKGFVKSLKRDKDKRGNENQGVNEDTVNDVRTISGNNHSDSAESDQSYDMQDDIDVWVPPPLFSRRIYQGKLTKARDFPFIAAILFFNRFQCGGSIIKSDLVLTAASGLQLAWNNRFFRENPSFLSVRVGSNLYDAGGERIPVLEIYFHPEYNPKNLKHNLAVLRLIYKIRFKKDARRVKKIEIDRHANALPMETKGITIVGWGARSSSNIMYMPQRTRLTYDILDPYPFWDCQDIYSKVYVTDRHFCAGYMSKGSGACNRDIGNPGVAAGYLTGVVSFGSPVCGTPDAPTVFTKLGYYVDWLENIMQQETPIRKGGTTTTKKFKEKFYSFPTNVDPYWTLTPIQKHLHSSGNDSEPNDTFKSPLRHDSINSIDQLIQSVFTSKEIQQYAEYINQEVKSVEKALKENIARHITHIDQTKTTKKRTTTHTSIVKKSTKTKNTKSINPEKHTAVVDDNSVEKDLKNDIVKLIDNLDLKEIVEEEAGFKKKMKSHGKIDDDILTLLYLTEPEKDLNADNFDKDMLSSKQSDDEGIDNLHDSIKTENGTTKITDFLTKDELYSLLSEAIASETTNITKLL